MVAFSMARTSGYNKNGQNKRRCGQKEKREKIERGKKRERPKTSSEAEKAKLGLEQFPSLRFSCQQSLDPLTSKAESSVQNNFELWRFTRFES